MKQKLPRGITKYIFTFDAVVLELALVGQLVSTAEEVVRKEPQISYLRGGSGARTDTLQK